MWTLKTGQDSEMLMGEAEEGITTASERRGDTERRGRYQWRSVPSIILVRRHG